MNSQSHVNNALHLDLACSNLPISALNMSRLDEQTADAVRTFHLTIDSGKKNTYRSPFQCVAAKRP